MTYCRIKSEEELCPGYIKIPYVADNVMQFSLPLVLSAFF